MARDALGDVSRWLSEIRNTIPMSDVLAIKSTTATRYVKVQFIFGSV